MTKRESPESLLQCWHWSLHRLWLRPVMVRVCRGATEASAIKIEVGKPGGKMSELVNWQSDAKETDLLG